MKADLGLMDPVIVLRPDRVSSARLTLDALVAEALPVGFIVTVGSICGVGE